MDVSNMPQVVPVPIKTKDEPTWTQIKRWITSIRKWKLVEDWEYKLPNDGPTVVIPKGFIFDGASIPKVLWGVLSPTGLLFIPGLIHDFGYRYDYLWALDSSGSVYKYDENSGQVHWDLLFREVGMEVNGMAIIDKIAWFTLVIFGGWAWEDNRKRKEPELQPARPLGIDANESEHVA